MKRYLIVGLILMAGLAMFGLARPLTAAQPVLAAPQAIQLFQANRTGEEETPAGVFTRASGRATFVYDDDAMELHYMVAVYDIEGISGAHIHQGAAGVEGPVIITLFPDGDALFDPMNAISGMVPLTADQETALLAGNLYVNVHTGVNPAGEIRGQIEAYLPGSFNTIMTGVQERPAVVTDATGWAVFSLNAAMDVLQYHVYVTDIMTASAAHLHPGFPWESGPPEIPLYLPGDPDPFGTGNPISGSVPITEPHKLLNLISGHYYLNVHSPAYPAGEIRGQVLEGYHPFRSYLRGWEMTSAVDTSAKGMAVMVLDSDMESLHYRLSVSDITGVNEVWIHEGESGEDGPTVYQLFPNGGTVLDPDHVISGTLMLMPDEVTNLVAGRYYIVVHTEDNPGGEIRGQVEPYMPSWNAYAFLSGDNETTPVTTDAMGRAELRINPLTGGTSLHYMLEVSGTIAPTAAHIHLGFPGEDGPVEIPFYTSGDTRTFGPGYPISGDRELSPQNLLDLLSGYFYVNVHTAEYPAGMIRGQVFIENRVMMPVIMIE
jgi:hypothetical protein